MKHLLISTSLMEEIYFNNQISLVIHKFLEIYHKFNKIIYVLAINSVNEAEYYNITKLIKSFKKNYSAVISNTRNNAVGHMNPQLKEYYTARKEINTDLCLEIIESFLDWHSQLYNLYKKMIEEDSEKRKYNLKTNNLEYFTEIIDTLIDNAQSHNSKNQTIKFKERFMKD